MPASSKFDKDAVAFKFGSKSFTQADVKYLAKHPNQLYIEIRKQLNNEVNQIQAADALAKAFKVYGNIIVLPEYWYRRNLFRTFLDRFKKYENTTTGWLLHRAFRANGFKYGHECSLKEIRQACAQKKCIPYMKGRGSGLDLGLYEYKDIKSDNANLHKDLIEYLHHPRFILKWIESGNDIESYLQ
jgi:hypothetical protein